MKKIWIGLILACLLTTIAVNGELISYLLMQGRGQFEVLWNAQKIENFIKLETTGEELKSKIKLIEEVKSFAKDELGLLSDDLYTKIYDQGGEDILWNLSACEPHELKSVEWSFPIVGCVSYKGFFDMERAKREEQILREKGFDTRIRPVNAWSTLGWFSDPILSNNLERSEGGIAELFIHEITHTNVFFKDSLTFNENLASFIGAQGAKLFLSNKFGENSEQFETYERSEMDAQRFINHCLQGVKDLDSVYNSFDSNMSIAQKDSTKNAYIIDWSTKLDAIPFFDQQNYYGRFKEVLPNNAFFMAFDRYDSKKEAFAIQLETEFKGDLKSFVDYYKKQK